MGEKKRVHIIGGGTFHHMQSHLALSAPAFGTTARMLKQFADKEFDNMSVYLHLTKMADPEKGYIETNDDIADLVNGWVEDPCTKVIFFNAALCDLNGQVAQYSVDFKERRAVEPGKYSGRLASRDAMGFKIDLTPANKVVETIRKNRKDITLVAFKTTCGATEDEQYIAGLTLLKRASCNLVLANDVKTRLNMIITPEEARYHVTTDREHALKNLVEMANLRSHLTFTRSTVVAGEPISWESELVPKALRVVVDHCISQGAYKPFRGATVGHFAAKVDDRTFLTSRRKTNFNDLHKIGLVRIETDGPDSVVAYGSKPSVGGQSQRIIFHDHQEYDCIVHFHCPIKEGSSVPVVSQREFECGSHECGRNTSNGLKRFGNLSAVFLDQHGPNIVFNRSIDPQEVIRFIEDNFDLSQKTGGYVTI